MTRPVTDFDTMQPHLTQWEAQELAEQINAAEQFPTLATVAAANDEGVAEQAAQFADGVAEGAQSLYDLAARDRDTVGTLIHGEAVRVAKHIAAAIRLLSQGGGK